MSKFSVVIPLYNKETFIKRAIDSVLSQSFKEFELIVIDDGSTDSGADIARSIEDPRLRVAEQENMGVSATRNRGIMEAENDLLCFLDADDTWHCDFLAEITELISAYSDAGVFSTNYDIYTSDERRVNSGIRCSIKKGQRGVLENYFKSFAYGATPLNSINSCFRRKVFNSLGTFPLGIEQHEDMCMWITIALSDFKIVFSNNVYAYNRRDSQQKHQRAMRGRNERNLPYEKLLKDAALRSSDKDTKYILATLTKLYYMRAVNAMYCKDIGIARYWASKMQLITTYFAIKKFVVLGISLLPLKLIEGCFWASRTLKIKLGPISKLF